MPGKYSYNAVLSDYSSQGLIPIPNDKQIEYLRETSAPRTSRSASHRSRSHSAATLSPAKPTAGRDAAAEKRRITASPTPNPGGRRVLIFESDSDDERREASGQPRALDPTPMEAQRPQHTPTKPQRRPDKPRGTVRSTVGSEKPLAQEPQIREADPSERTTPSTPKRPRPRGVKEFIAARYHEESGIEQKVDAAGRKMSLYEFLNSGPRVLEMPKRQPRDPCAIADKAADSLNQRDISVKEFLDPVPAPPVETTTDKTNEIPDPPKTNTARSSPLISRLPRGVELRDRRSGLLPVHAETGAQNVPKDDLAVKPKSVTMTSGQPRRPVQVSSTREPATSRKDLSAMSPARKMPKSSHKHTESPTSARLAARTSHPPQEPLAEKYSLNFEGFTDHEDSYFPPTWADPGATKAQDVPLGRAGGGRANVATPRSIASALSPSSPIAQQTRTHRAASSRTSSISRPAGQQRLEARSPASPQVSLPYTGSTSSIGVESATTFEQAAKVPTPRKAGKQHGPSRSWGLPAIEQSGTKGSDFSNMFDGSDRSCDRDILIFTSDEEEEEDDLPTPRLQQLEEDVRFPSSEWGMISAGRHVMPGAKDADSMSELSAIYPPDIGRHTNGGEYGSPLAVAWQNMHHGGEPGAAYKPQDRLLFRSSLNASGILQRLGMKRNKSNASSVGGDSASGKSKTKAKPKFHPSSSARGRLPINL